MTDHILYLISDLQTLSAALIGQSEPMLASHWSADNERCPHGTQGQLGRGAGRRFGPPGRSGVPGSGSPDWRPPGRRPAPCRHFPADDSVR